MTPTRIFHIQGEIARLKQAIAEERKRPEPDSLKIKALKSRRLALKDGLLAARLTTTPREHWI